MMSEELQDAIDALLGHACPDWTPPPRVDPASADADYRRYERIERTRLRLGRALARRPELTARLFDPIVEALLLEPNATDQLTAPLIAAVGRRAVLRRLIDAVREGPCERRANAATAAYWVRCWQHPLHSERLRAAFEAGARTPDELKRQLPPRPEGIDDRVTDLWPVFWQACLTTFVECEDPGVRDSLQTAFPVEDECYPPSFAGALEQARRIAASDPGRFARMRDRTTGYGHRI